MTRNGKVSAAIALCCTAIGVALTGCEEASEASAPPATSDAPAATSTTKAEDQLTGTEKIQVDGKSVNVSCSGELAEGKPAIILLHGGGHSLDTMADLQQTLGEKNRVCSYDRLGAGKSDQPDGPQTLSDSGRVLTAVIDQVAGDAPVVLAGHSLGGLIAARYAPDHQDRVEGLVLMDATSPTQTADIEAEIPESASGAAAQARGGTLAALQGQSPEKIVVPDGEVATVGDIPVEVIQHGKQHLAEAVPEFGEGLERAWSEGQRKWLTMSSNSTLSTAANSGHDIYLDEPDVAVQAIQRVVDEIG